MTTYIYIFDKFKELPISFSDILEAWEDESELSDVSNF